MGETQTDTKKNSGNLWLWMILLPILYVLSIGPVAWVLHVTKAGRTTEQAAEVFYYPVMLAAEKSGRLDIYEGYLKLWIPGF